MPEQRVSYHPVKTGSLYQVAYNAQMFSDRRAYRVGDILTIKLEEENKFSKDADTMMDKDGKHYSNRSGDLFGRTGASILGSGNSLGFNIEPKRQSHGKSNYKQEQQTGRFDRRSGGGCVAQWCATGSGREVVSTE